MRQSGSTASANGQFSHKSWLQSTFFAASALAAVGAFGLTCNSAKADSIAYLNAMLADSNPNILVEDFTLTTSANSFALSGLTSSNTATQFQIQFGPDAGSTLYYGTISGSGDSSGGSLTETITIPSLMPSTQTLFTSTQLLPSGFGPVAGQPDITYWFAFTEDTATFYAPAGAVIGGLVTDEGDIKEYVFTPTPGTVQSGLALLLGVAFCEGYRRLRANSIRLS